jgi:hypothetical protein
VAKRRVVVAILVVVVVFIVTNRYQAQVWHVPVPLPRNHVQVALNICGVNAAAPLRRSTFQLSDRTHRQDE